MVGIIMPGYCHSCPYKKFCKDQYVKDPTCPMGYTPVGQEATGQRPGDVVLDESTRHIHQPEVLLRIAKAAMNRNDYKTSVECYNKILEIRPNDAEASFLLKRANYMISSEGASAKKPSKGKPSRGAGKKAAKEKGPAMLPQQQIGKIQIKPKQQFKIDPHIIGPESDRVYGVEEDEEERTKEEVSKHVARRTKGSVLKRKGTMIAFALSIAIIVMIVVGLYLFGFLQF